MPTELEINVSPIFSTPLLVFTPASHKQINAALSQKILEREASVPTYSDYEVAGWSSPHDLTMLDWAGDPLRELFCPVMEVANKSRPSPNGPVIPPADLIGRWSRSGPTCNETAAAMLPIPIPAVFGRESITWT
jgi:hypothetical protein